MDVKTYIERLRRIRKLNTENKDYVNRDLYKWLCRDVSFVEAYESIKNNKGALTPGIAKISLEGFGRARINKILAQLKSEKWKPKPARRVLIPKSRKEKRPLEVQGPDEKIVQAIVYRLLEAIYEPIFLDCSYGFRPNRGCHDALKDISQKYDGTVFAIEGDIKGMYNKINHHTLIKIIRMKVADERLISLIWKLLKAGYMEVDNSIIRPEIGTPQGSILSPILANIYLHEFDKYMQIHVTERFKRKKLRTPEAIKLASLTRRLEKEVNKIEKKETEDSKNSKQELLKELKRVKSKSLKVKPYKDPEPRVYFHRYADDFIIGIAGSRNLADSIKTECTNYLMENLQLTLNEEKTKVTNMRKVPAVFLGYEILIHTSEKIKYVYEKGKRPFKKRTTGKFVKLQAPIHTAVNRMHLKGFCNGEGFPTPKRNWTSQEDSQIINLYNSTIRGWFNYYRGCHFQHRLGRIWYILHYSCAMTLASKHKSSISKIFKKHGKALKVQYGSIAQQKSIELVKPIMTEANRKFFTGKDVKDPYSLIFYKTSQTRIFDNCAICGQPAQHMHHINPQRKSKPGTVDYISGLLKRKQIPTCVECHTQIHNGSYQGIALKSLVREDVIKN
uniref:putative reverse transcriptase and intron maturase n=1 Tax=Massjukichlorella minus TaxID=2650457 RepID=UPI0024118C7D|nr:putative reverse transcriptase and intron maturase [Massjukichlorella minus]WDY13011.1 putative reverse transcriptase and intron maturase [Massjukichlorella minus]